MHRLPIASILLVATPALAQVPGEGFEVERYGVELRPDLKTTAVSGIETIVLRSRSDRLARVAFSGNALAIERATADGRPVAVSRDNGALVFLLPRPLRTGRKTTLRFAFAGKPARGVEGIPGGIQASYFACDWMVCLQDAPGDKAHLVLDLYLPSGAVSLGAGRALPLRQSGQSLTLHRWRTTRPYSPYLYGFAAGFFAQSVEQMPLGELVYFDASGSPADLPRRFAKTPAMAAFFADKAGLGLPDRRYAQLLIPGSVAQETASFSLVGKDELDREARDPESAWIIAHELAHQWWGNLVTCASWRDFWLNEGMTTFMAAAWKQHDLGEMAYRRELDGARRRLARAREAGFDKPLAWDGDYPSLSTRRAVQYGKGALFVAHLRETLGEDAFWAGIRLYTRRHAGGTVTSRDFQRAMEQVSGRDLAPVFEEWVFGKDAPPA